MRRKRCNNRSRAGGFSIIAAIFLLVVIGLMAAFMVNIGAVSRTSSAFSIVGVRAKNAALAGVEWAAHEVLGNPATPACLAPGASFTVDSGVTAFQVTAVCVPDPVTEGADSYTVFDIDVVAEFGVSGNEDYFRREMSASVSTAN